MMQVTRGLEGASGELETSLAPLVMRVFSALSFLLTGGLLGCDAFGPPSVRYGVVTSVTVERLDLDRRWDGDLFSRNPPDVYVDVKSVSGRPGDTFASAFPKYRSTVIENVEPGRLPWTVRTEDEAPRISLSDSMWVNVSDRDGSFDDLMYTSGTFRLGDRYDGAEAGTYATFRFEGDDGALRVTVRWD